MSREDLHLAPVPDCLRTHATHQDAELGWTAQSVNHIARSPEFLAHGSGDYNVLVINARGNRFIDCEGPLNDNPSAANNGDCSVPDELEANKGEVAKRLRQLRLALGYTNQTAWCVFLGNDKVITVQHWNNWEKGRAIPDATKERRIMLKTGADPAWIRWGIRSGLPHHLIEKLDEQERLEAEANEKRA